VEKCRFKKRNLERKGDRPAGGWLFQVPSVSAGPEEKRKGRRWGPEQRLPFFEKKKEKTPLPRIGGKFPGGVRNPHWGGKSGHKRSVFAKMGKFSFSQKKKDSGGATLEERGGKVRTSATGEGGPPKRFVRTKKKGKTPPWGDTGHFAGETFEKL